MPPHYRVQKWQLFHHHLTYALLWNWTTGPPSSCCIHLPWLVCNISNNYVNTNIYVVLQFQSMELKIQTMWGWLWLNSMFSPCHYIITRIIISYMLIVYLLLQGLGYYLSIAVICVATVYHMVVSRSSRIHHRDSLQQICSSCNCSFWLVKFIYLFLKNRVFDHR